MLEDDEQDYWEVVTLIDEKGNPYRLHIIEEVEIDDKFYFIAIPEDLDEDDENVIILEEFEDTYLIVKDEKIIRKLEKVLEEIAFEENIESITLLGSDGTRNEYDVLDSIEFEGKKYVIAIDISNNDQFVVFWVNNNKLVLIDNEKFLTEIVALFNKKNIKNFSYIDLEDLKDKSISITLEDNDGKPIDVTVLGKLEIKGKEYLVTLSPDGENDFAAVYLEGSDNSTVLKNETSSAINYYLKSIKTALKKSSTISPELN